MSDKKKSDSNLLLKLAQLDLHLFSQLLIKRTKWFIQQQNLRLFDQCPGQCNTLPLTAGEFICAALTISLEFDQFKGLINTPV